MSSSSRIRRIAAAWAVALLLGSAAVVAVVFPGSNPSYAEAFIHWLWRIPATLCIWAALEWASERFLGMRFWQRLPSVVRVLLLAALGAALLFVCMAVTRWASEHGA